MKRHLIAHELLRHVERQIGRLAVADERTFVLSDRAGSLAAALERFGRRARVVDGVQPSAGSGAIEVMQVSSANPAEIEDAVRECHEELSAGDLLILDLARGIRARAFFSNSARTSTAWSRDNLGTLLFRHGFVRFRSTIERSRILMSAVRSAASLPGDRSLVLSIVVPVFNERETVHKVLDQLLDKRIPGFDVEIVVVESNSTDGSREEVLSYGSNSGLRVVLEDRPKGKGHAVRAGLKAATGDIILIQDADLEYDIGDYELLLEPLRRFTASFVLGVRAKSHGARFGVRHFEKEVITGYVMNLGNHFFLWLFNTVYRSKLRDPFTMYKVFRRDCIDSVKLECNRFDFDWELVGKFVRLGLDPGEVIVNYHSRHFSEGKKIRLVRDPLTWFVACFRYRFASLED